MRQLQKPSKEQNLSVALGQIVMLATHFATVLGVPTKHPMIFNGHRSMIVNSKQETISLYLTNRNDYKTIDQGISLLEANLKRIKRALERL
jgi:K+/H+ antiporter YhaU regulatory subunit KhtT